MKRRCQRSKAALSGAWWTRPGSSRVPALLRKHVPAGKPGSRHGDLLCPAPAPQCQRAAVGRVCVPQAQPPTALAGLGRNMAAGWQQLARLSLSPSFQGVFLSSFPTWTLVGGHTVQTTRAITEPVFMRVTESARCSQATTQRCQAGPQHGGDTLLCRQQQQCRGEAGCRAVLADRGAHQGAGTAYRNPPMAPLGPPRDWPVRSNGTSLPAVPGSSQDADDVARPARLPGAGCPCCKAWQFSNFVLS